MRKRIKKILIITITTVMTWNAITALAQETLLRWKNGDSLAGKLLESKSGKIRWASPYFSDDLIVDTDVLDSVVFSKQSAPVTETFRVGTVSGDVWVADLIDSDESTFLFSSKRFGKFRVNRSTIFSFENRSHSNLIFDGSQLTAWTLDEKAKIRGRKQTTNNQLAGWYPDRSGHPHTSKGKANIFRAIEWPKRFEIDLELASTTRAPGFVFALGKNLYETLRVETWVHELVVVQGTLFEPILKIVPDLRNFRLRLAYDQELGILKIFDLNGNLLLKLDNVKPTLESSGIYIYNRGQDLTVRRLRVYRQPAGFKNQEVDFSKPRIHMMSGEVFYGKLFVEGDKSYVLSPDGKRQDINIKQVDRVVQPGRTLTPIAEHMGLRYIDSSLVRGHLIQLNPDSVVLQTAFASEPITCSLAGASQLRLESKTKTEKLVKDYDKMFFPSGSLRGHVFFGGKDDSSLRWQSIGMMEPTRLSNNRSTRIERNSKRVSRLPSFDVPVFPHLLHLKNGEVIPCQVLTYDETAISFKSPFITVTRMDASYMKGIEFTRGKTHGRKENRNPITITGGDKHRIILEDGRILEAKVQRAENDGGLKIVVNSGKQIQEQDTIVITGDFAENDAVALKRGVELLFDPLETQSEKLTEKAERALTVPRFNRDNPPSHILVANNGDLKRGKLISFNGETIQFESQLKQIVIPINRVARVIDISVDTDDKSVKEGDGSQQSETENEGFDVDQTEIRFTLIHNPILIFEPLEVKGERLFGRSPIYGDVSVPVKSIQYTHFGDKAKTFRSVFAEWVVRSAKEPDFGADR